MLLIHHAGHHAGSSTVNCPVLTAIATCTCITCRSSCGLPLLTVLPSTRNVKNSLQLNSSNPNLRSNSSHLHSKFSNSLWHAVSCRFMQAISSRQSHDEVCENEFCQAVRRAGLAVGGTQISTYQAGTAARSGGRIDPGRRSWQHEPRCGRPTQNAPGLSATHN